jgi:secreted PhoX family phosphatase
LKGAAALTAGAAALPALQGLGLLSERGRVYAANNAGYGQLRPTSDERDGVARITLPPGFKYRTFSLSNNGETMTDGNPVPLAHDGMGGWNMGDGTVRLVRNHEDRNDPNEGSINGEDGYDETAGAGCVTLVVDAKNRELLSHFVSQNGSIVNCAGGMTPWNSWITCEETNDGIPDGWDAQHGYCFDVPVTGNGPSAATGPFPAMGRFAHEAIAVAPNGVVYETEDSGNTSGFYRFIPNSFGDLSTGLLQMLRHRDIANYLTYAHHNVGDTLPVSWVTIADPDPPLATPNDDVFNQGAALGGAHFGRLEGCWYSNGSIFFVSTSGGSAESGQVWEYKIDADTITLIFESPGPSVLDSPDNLTVSPNQSLLLCEDGDGSNFLRGVTPDGEIFDFSENIENSSEWAGAIFIANGNDVTLYVNRQGSTDNDDQVQGMTFAIWGPWNKGAL